MSEDSAIVVERIIQRHGTDRELLIPILQAVQREFGWLSDDAIVRIAELMGLAVDDVEAVVDFYAAFRRNPMGEHVVRVCHGTACHVKGAEQITRALYDYLSIDSESDTDADRLWTVQRVACLGCCTLAPVVEINGIVYGHLTADAVGGMIEDYKDRQSRTGHTVRRSASTGPLMGEIRVGLGSCCVVKGARELFDALADAIDEARVHVKLTGVGCVGSCYATPSLEVVTADDAEPVHYVGVTAADAAAIVHRHFAPAGWWRRFQQWLLRHLDTTAGDLSHVQLSRHAVTDRDPILCAFLGPQQRVVTEQFGRLDPMDLEAYVAGGGFSALQRVAEDMDSEQILSALELSGLRGRGGAGFETALKWRAVRDADSDEKYVLCNGDEGDPGAFMDRMLLESFPYRVLEGMLIAAWCVRAHTVRFYIRAEYPLAVDRVRYAIARAREAGWFDPPYAAWDAPVTVEVFEGAGMFVCGEETALIASMHGHAGRPRKRPPYPVTDGFRHKPTLVNNVETFCNIPWIIRHGGAAFASVGINNSRGTKVFSLAGKVQRGGLVEVPMGVSIREIVEQIGGGVGPGRQFKAVQIGGPSGGCLPASLSETPIDYESLRAAGAIMGSGGLVVLDDRDCMVDIARYFLRFTAHESCGRCRPCRDQTREMAEILDRICDGQGARADLQQLEEMSHRIIQTSLCGLGKTAPNPVLTTLRYFQDEYEAHLAGRCPAGRCVALIDYHITDRCIGCTLCARACAAGAIEFAPYRRHTVDMTLCTRCDACRQVCPEQAVEVLSGGLPCGV